MSDAEGPWPADPFRIGTSEQFGRLRETLTALGYTEREICSRLRVETIHDAAREAGDHPTSGEPTDPQGLLLRLFLETRPAAASTVQTLLSPGDRATLEELGLLLPIAGDRYLGAVFLYPMQGLYIASDRRADSDSRDAKPPADIVFPAVGRTTERFVRLMPRTPCEDFLELCSGTGIAALLAANRFAARAWAVDITDRATRFAQFNAAVNAIDNAVVLCGDLYEPVAGRTFDRIVAHPPYVPTLADEYVFRDGGVDGERITWGILQGLPSHLRPGGQFLCDCVATDRKSAPLEQRVRAALGVVGEEFDILVAEAAAYDATLYFAGLAKEGRESFAEVGQRHALFERLGVEQFVSAPIVIRRRTVDDRPPVTARRRLSPYTTAADLDWALDWHANGGSVPGRAGPDLLSARLRANVRSEVQTTQRIRDGEWLVDRCCLRTEVPFSVELTCPGWYAPLLMHCDGQRTGRELLRGLKEAHLVPEDAPEAPFAEMLRQLIGLGLLVSDEPSQRATE